MISNKEPRVTMTVDRPAETDSAPIERAQSEIFPTQEPEGGWTKFDRDPEALAWARGHCERLLAQIREQRGRNDDPAVLAVLGAIRAGLVDGSHTIFAAAFDERKPDMIAASAADRSECGGAG
jgi:hypothetical protein